jgi:hypothetical protein
MVELFFRCIVVELVGEEKRERKGNEIWKKETGGACGADDALHRVMHRTPARPGATSRATPGDKQCFPIVITLIEGILVEPETEI